MSKFTRLFFAVFLLGVTAINVKRGNALSAAICAAGAMCWLMEGNE